MSYKTPKSKCLRGIFNHIILNQLEANRVKQFETKTKQNISYLNHPESEINI